MSQGNDTFKLPRRAVIRTGAALAAATALTPLPRRAARAETVGVTATEIKIGNTSAYSGPASAYSAGAKLLTAYFRMVNEQGGINGRRINFISMDDGYNPAKTVEVVRRLVEQEEVAFLCALLGTAPNSAIQKYVNIKKVPHIFVASGANKWADPEHFPWTIGWAPSYRTEGQIYARYILAERPSARIAVLYQNDDLGKDYIAGLADVLGADFDRHVVRTASYEVTDPTIDSQIVTLKDSGADCLVSATTPKFAAQMIRRVYEIGWKPLHCMTNVSASVAAVMRPAGPSRGIGIVTSTYVKDPNDPAWKNDPGMNEVRAFIAAHSPESDSTDVNVTVAYGYAVSTMQVLKQCGDDLSRENIMRQAANIHDLDARVLFPGIRINTSPTNFHPIRQMQLTRWNGEFWEVFGKLLEGGTV